MEALGAIGSVVGIVSLGVQLSQTIQQQLDLIENADYKLTNVVFEISSTADAIADLNRLIEEDDKRVDDPIFNNRARTNLKLIIRKCHQIFRDVAFLWAKAGKGVQVEVEKFQREVEEWSAKENASPKSEPTLHIELSAFEHVKMTWRIERIERYSLELEKHKTSLTLFLTLNSLAKKKKSLPSM